MKQRQSENGMKQLCDLLRRENSDRIFHLWPCWLQRGNRHWLWAEEIRDQEKNKVQNSEYESQIVAWFFLVGDKMQRKVQPFQVSLQMEERTLLVSDVREGYSLDQSQGQMQEDYAKPDSMEGIIELLLYTHGSNPAICNLFLFFFFSSCWDRFPDSVPEKLATTIPLSFLLKRQAIIQKSENDAVSMVPKLCARV